MKKLQVADDFALPLDAVTQTFAILAKRGVGKTYTASVMAEEMLKADQSIIAIDPTGAWWGLRSKYPVVIFGGEHADVPLEESAGEVVARSVVENRFPAVIDLSLFRKGQTIRFMVAFAEALYRLNREAVHLFVDEADAVAPQARNYGGDENRMLGAMEDIVRRGRKRGIGCTLITQRPAVLNKNVLTQCEVLVALRLVHPKDIDAVMEWVNVHGDPAVAKAMTESLPELPIGTAWFWSPGWGEFFQRVKVRKRETFDSGATPKAGEKAAKPKHMAEIDLAALGEQIKATVEQVKANDPAALRKEIAELKRQLAGRPAETVEVVKEVPVPVLANGQLEGCEALVRTLQETASAVLGGVGELRQSIALAVVPKVVHSGGQNRPSVPAATKAPAKPAVPRVHNSSPAAAGVPDGGFTGAEQRILDALAELEALGASDPEKVQVALLAGYTNLNSKGFSNSIGRLRTGGMIEYPASGRMALTAAGRQAANAPARPRTSAEIQERFVALLGGTFARVLRPLIDAYPRPVSKADLMAAAGYGNANSKGFSNTLGRLRSLGLVDYPATGQVAARPILFLGG